jgi:2-polyprenyl-6-methoxyphenol hydroxylase-like FAD-dependent oxidoreductase
MAHWYQTPLFLVGDAAHAMTPNMGQGANSAMVDALVLVRLLASALQTGEDLEAVGRQYESIRKAFVTRIQQAARLVGRVAELSWEPACRVRNTMMKNAMRLHRLNRSSMLQAAGYNPRETAFLAKEPNIS